MKEIPFAEIFSFHLIKGKIPLYRQVYQQVREYILSGQLPSGVRLPSSRDLASRLGVSRNTIISAYEQLWAEGFIEGQVGSGSYVAPIEVSQLISHEPLTSKNLPKLSQQGEHLAQIPDKDVVSQAVPFSPGIPDLQAFPHREWGRMLSRKCRSQMEEVFAYEEAAGYKPLRQAVCEYLRSCRGVKCDLEQIIITSGAQQGLDLIARLLVDPGEKIAMEDPGYLGARNAFLSARAKLIPIPVDDEGICSEMLHDHKNLRLVYTTPSHQYPLGSTMSLARRVQLLQWAEQNNAWVVEDDYDSEYRYQGQPIAAMQGMDTSSRVVYLGTFSKVLFPGLRLGYLVVPKKFARTFARAKSIADSHSSNLLQSVLAEFIMDGSFTNHLRRMRILYKEKQSIFCELWEKKISKKKLANCCILKPSPAGMHLVALFKDGYDDQKIAEAGARLGLHLRPLSCYYLAKSKSGLVLGYTGVNKKQMAEGIDKTFQVISRYIRC